MRWGENILNFPGHSLVINSRRTAVTSLMSADDFLNVKQSAVDSAAARALECHLLAVTGERRTPIAGYVEELHT